MLLADRKIIVVIITMIVVLVVLGNKINGTCHRFRIFILTIVHLVPVIIHAVHVITKAAPDLGTALDPAPLWSVVVVTMMNLRASQPVPAVPVSLRENDMTGQVL